MPRINQQALKTELAKRGFESISIKRELPGGRVEVDANKLHPVHDEGGEAIYAPVPVSLSVELDGRGQVKSIAGDTPNPTAVADANRGGFAARLGVHGRALACVRRPAVAVRT